MTNPDQPTVGDLTARLEFRYENDPLDFLKTGKGYLVVDDKVATIPLPTGEKGERGDDGRLAEGDVRYFNRRTEDAEAAAEASEASAVKSKNSETKAKASEAKAKTSETNAKTSEGAAKTSETNAKSSENNAKASEAEATRQAGIAANEAAAALEHKEQAGEYRTHSEDAATLAIVAAATLERHVADRDPTDDDIALKGSVWVSPDQVWMRGENGWHPLGGARGLPGRDGLTPRIEGGTWWIGDTDTGVPAQGGQVVEGATPEIIDGTWWVGDRDTGVPATGPQGNDGQDGQDGKDGLTPHIAGGTWWVGDANTGVTAEGKDGQDGKDGLTPRIVNGVWWIGDTNTGVPATGGGGTGIAPPRTPRILVYSGTDTPSLADFPDAQVGDLIERTSDGARWKVEE